MSEELTEVIENEEPVGEIEAAGSGVEGELIESGTLDVLPEANPEVARLAQAALQIAMQMRQLMEGQEQIVMLLVKPDLLELFEKAFRAVPENILPADFVSKVPIMPQPECDGVRIITRTDLIQDFLLNYYGPPAGGGNDLIRAMEEAISRIPNCPIRVDLKALEVMFLLEMKERVKPGIIVPTGAAIRQGIPNLRR